MFYDMHLKKNIFTYLAFQNIPWQRFLMLMKVALIVSLSTQALSKSELLWLILSFIIILEQVWIDLWDSFSHIYQAIVSLLRLYFRMQF